MFMTILPFRGGLLSTIHVDSMETVNHNALTSLPISGYYEFNSVCLTDIYMLKS